MRHICDPGTQCEGEPIVEIRAGDVIWCPPGHKHWHGATPTTAMTHIAVTEALDGKNVDGEGHRQGLPRRAEISVVRVPRDVRKYCPRQYDDFNRWRESMSDVSRSAWPGRYRRGP